MSVTDVTTAELSRVSVRFLTISFAAVCHYRFNEQYNVKKMRACHAHTLKHERTDRCVVTLLPFIGVVSA